jgi:serine phosphatase RsbU (regulator of sigma subunit)
MAASPLYTGISQFTLPAVAPGARNDPAYTALEQQLDALRLEFADFHRELFEAAQLQRTLSGPRRLLRGDFEIVAEIFPVRHLSGDFFNVSDLGAATMLAIGDIAGKGLLAGMWFTHLLGLTRMYGESLADPALALTAMNAQMCASSLPAPLTSVFLARLDSDTRQLVYCNAGHPPPILLRCSGTLEFLDEGGPVMGAVSQARFAAARVTIEPGDILVGYSDGLLECRNQHDEEFGVERVIQELVKSAPNSTSELLFSIIGAAQDFAGAAARHDDCTLMVVQCGK